jgi:uncharacterized protein (TIGR03086 family)
MTISRAPALVAALDLLERAINYTRISLQFVTPSGLSRPTPCAEWDLRRLLAHMDDSLAALREAAELGTVRLTPNADQPADLIASVRTQACDLLAAWVSDGGADLIRVAGSPVSAAVLVTAGALEVTVHGWDVAQACGSSHPIPASLADELVDLVPFLISSDDRPTRFADVLPLPASPAADQRLLAAVGRSAPIFSPGTW